LSNQFEDYDNPEVNKTQKLKDEIFLIKNIYMKRENEIFNLENYLKKLKSNKKHPNETLESEVFMNNYGEINSTTNNNENVLVAFQINNSKITKEEDIIIKKIINNELEKTREIYRRIINQTICLKNSEKENLKKISELKNEIEGIKLVPSSSLNSKNINDLKTMPSLNTVKCGKDNSVIIDRDKTETEVHTHKKDYKDNKDFNISIFTQKTNIDENPLNPLNKNEIKYKKIEDELTSKKTEINDLNQEIESQKKLNEKIEAEWINLNNELSQKFSLIFQLEMKLDRLKLKKKKEVKKEQANNL
jgi:hypothetical protein